MSGTESAEPWAQAITSLNDSFASLLAELTQVGEDSQRFPELAFSTKRAAAALDLTRTGVIGLMNRGDVATCRIGGRRAIPRGEIERLSIPMYLVGRGHFTLGAAYSNLNAFPKGRRSRRRPTI